MDAQFALGNVLESVFSVDEALRKASYAGNEYYQSVASRVLYGEGTRDGMLGRVAQGWEGLFRIWWELEVSKNVLSFFHFCYLVLGYGRQRGTR